MALDRFDSGSGNLIKVGQSLGTRRISCRGLCDVSTLQDHCPFPTTWPFVYRAGAGLEAETVVRQFDPPADRAASLARSTMPCHEEGSSSQVQRPDLFLQDRLALGLIRRLAAPSSAFPG